MAKFQPLTEEQFKKATEAGFSYQQIVENEKRRKQEFEQANTPGWFQSLAQGIAKPFLKTGLSVARVGQGTAALLSGNKEKINQVAQDIGKPKDFGYFGNVRVGGFDEQGKQLSTKGTVYDALGTGAEIASYGVGGAGAAKAGQAAFKGSIGRAALRGAKTGAQAGFLGGAGQEMQDVEFGNEKGGVVGALAQGAVSGFTGALAGGALGAAGGALGKLGRKAVPSARVADAQQKAVSRITPTPKELTPTEYQKLVRAGKITPGTRFRSAQIAPSAQELELAKTYSHLLPSDNSVVNANKIISEISKVDDEVGQFLANKKVIYNTGELKNALMQSLKDVDDIAVDPARLANAKEKLVDGFIRGLEKNDLESLWRLRKNYDFLIKERLKAFGGTPTLKKDLAKGIRTGAQDFINNQLRDDTTYSAAMKEMTNMFRLLSAVEKKARAAKGGSAIAQWMKKNPNAKKTLIFLASLASAGVLGKSIIGGSGPAEAATSLTQ